MDFENAEELWTNRVLKNHELVSEERKTLKRRSAFFFPANPRLYVPFFW